MTQNVVTYTVVITVDNQSGRLLPYLTARIQFEVQSRKGVLLVPNAALRWQPNLRNILPQARDAYTRAVRRATAPESSPDRTGPVAPREPRGFVWIRNVDFVRPIEIRIGVSDGLVTEISGEGLEQGMEIVVGVNRVDSEPDALSILPHTWSEEPKE
jgi:HlyD family secretion protein